METTVNRRDGVTIIIPDGELDVYTSPSLKDIINQEIGQGHLKVVINLKKVTYLDSSALGVLVSGLKAIRRKKGSLKLSDLTESVEKVFQLTRLSKFFEIYDSEDGAVISF
jgi:anti-sigma B factor antagonist